MQRVGVNVQDARLLWQSAHRPCLQRWSALLSGAGWGIVADARLARKWPIRSQHTASCRSGDGDVTLVVSDVD